MNTPTTDCQLYLISPLDVGGEYPQRLERAIDAGEGLVTAFQFRVKDVEQHEAASLAAPLQEICAAHDVAFVVNDSVPLAKRLKADGVHLGQGDGDVKEAFCDGSGRDRRGLCRFRRVLPLDHQRNQPPCANRDTKLVEHIVRAALCGDWRDHAKQLRAAGRSGRRFSRCVRGSVERG